MGGDEVHNECWNSSVEIQNWMKDKGWGLEKQDFFKLWEYFQQKAQANVFKVVLIDFTNTFFFNKNINTHSKFNDFSLVK